MLGRKAAGAGDDIVLPESVDHRPSVAAIALLNILRHRYRPLHPSNHARKTMLHDV